MNTQPEFAAWIGLDWADQSHFICLCPGDQARPEQSVLPQQPDAIHRWAAQLRLRFGGHPVALALEQSRGPLLYALMQYDFLVLFPVNPQALASYLFFQIVQNRCLPVPC